MRAAIGLTVAAALAIGAAVWLLPRAPVAPPVAEQPVVKAPVSFADLPGWADEDFAAALAVFRAGCPKLRDAAWVAVCARAGQAAKGGERAFFESSFIPTAITGGPRPQGLFTGYYEPVAAGSRARGGIYQTPMYARPRDLVGINLADFSPDLPKKILFGRIDGDRLRPYADRAEIDASGIKDAKVLFWMADPVELFFLQIQGSGKVALPDGGLVNVGFDGKNGRPYRALGRVMADRGLIPRDGITMPAIRDWLSAHPDQTAGLLHENPSYVFFRETGTEGPFGALGVALTPGRSVAVDPDYVPLGAPVWIDAAIPDPARGGQDRAPLRRLLVAQDTGGAIKGAIRGDLFWGPGAQAAMIAGTMQEPGRWWVLLPK